LKSGHFEFEAKLMLWAVLILIALVLISGLILPWLMKQAEIDRCLDAGGAYDYRQSTCDGAESR